MACIYGSGMGYLRRFLLPAKTDLQWRKYAPEVETCC